LWLCAGGRALWGPASLRRDRVRGAGQGDLPRHGKEGEGREGAAAGQGIVNEVECRTATGWADR
jgi:hypothetical protein